MAYYSMYDMMYGYSGFGFFGQIFMLVFWIAIIWMIVWIVKQTAMNKQSSHDILDKRLANGEISKKEYIELKKTLRK